MGGFLLLLHYIIRLEVNHMTEMVATNARFTTALSSFCLPLAPVDPAGPNLYNASMLCLCKVRLQMLFMNEEELNCLILLFCT